MTIPKFKVMNLMNIVLLLIALIQYYLLTPLNAGNEKFITVLLEIDHKIKLIPGFIIPYLSIYIFLFLMLYLIIRKKESADMTVFLFSVVILWSIINFAHGFFPVINTIRPEIKADGFFFDAVNSLYSSVKPFNTFPNWQVSTAVLCALVYRKLNFGRFIPMVIWTVLICLSPLFLKMTYLTDVLVAIPLPFFAYKLAQKISIVTVKNEKVTEVVKIFSLESLIQSIAIGMRDENTISSMVDNLTRIEKNLTEKDIDEIRKTGSALDPPVESLKQVINNFILAIDVEKQIEKAKEMFGKDIKAFVPTDKNIKEAGEELINIACRPFDNPKFRYCILEIKKRNSGLINTNSLEEAARERSGDVIFKFKSFIESNKNNLPALKAIIENTNGHTHISFDEIKTISRELRKPPYEISTEEVWNAFLRLDSTKVKPLGETKNPANIITLTQYAIGKTDRLEPYTDSIDKKLNDWISENELKGRKFTEEELVWLRMMKNHVSSFLEINMMSFNQPPFVNKGGAAKAYNIFGPDLNRIMYEFNEKLI